MYLEKIKKVISIKLIIQLILKVTVLFFGFYILYFTINLITINNPNLFPQIFSLVSSAFFKIMPALKWLLNNMITYLKKMVGNENITEYIPLTSDHEVVEKTANNFKYYRINSRGVRKILMTRNEEYREYYLTLEDLWNCL
jgi:hypothetical protein